MRPGSTGAVLLCTALLLGGCASLGSAPARMSVEDIVQASRSGMPADEIVQRIRASGAIYELSATELVRLHERGVPDRVLDAMQATRLEAVRRREALHGWATYGTWGPPGWGYGLGYAFGPCWPYRCW